MDLGRDTFFQLPLVHGVLWQLKPNKPELMASILTTHQTRPAKPNPDGQVTVAQQTTHPEIMICLQGVRHPYECSIYADFNQACGNFVHYAKILGIINIVVFAESVSSISFWVYPKDIFQGLSFRFSMRPNSLREITLWARRHPTAPLNPQKLETSHTLIQKSLTYAPKFSFTSPTPTNVFQWSTNIQWEIILH